MSQAEQRAQSTHDALASSHKYRLKPPTFDRNYGQFEEWKYKFTAYMGLNNNRYPLLLEQTGAATATIDETRLRGVAATTEEGNENVQLSADLRYILISITSGSAAMICRQYQHSTGFEIWRQLHIRFMIPTGTRGVAYLTRLLKPTFDANNFEDSFTAWEYELNKFETENQAPLPDAVKVAIILNETKGPLQQRLQLQAETNPTFSQIRTVIMEYYKSIAAFSRMQQASASAQVSHLGGGQAPMDIGAINKGKGKGYGGKGKYNNNSKGKGKQKSFYNSGKEKGFKGGFGKGKGKPQQKGWYQQQPVGQAATGKGYGQQMNGGKGKGIGKSATNICYKCGNPGHIARDCGVAVYNLGEATAYDDQTTSWWNDQHYDQSWWHQDLQQHQPVQQQLALPPTPVIQQPQQVPQAAEQIHYISGVGNNLLIAAIGHQQARQAGQATDHSRAELMIDSGAATHVCPQWFAPTSPLHPLSKEQGPKLRSVTNDNIQLYDGYKWVYMQNTDGQNIVIPFYVCNVHQPILSVTRLAEQGFTLQFGDNPNFHHPKGFTARLEQRDSLYYLNTRIMTLPDNPQAEHRASR